MMAMIRENRQRFHLEPHEVHRAKVLYQYQNNNFVPFNFGFQRACSIGDKLPPKDILKYILEEGAWVEL